MSGGKAKKSTKTATKSCPRCDSQVPVACKSCTCGNVFISRKLLGQTQAEKVPPVPEVKLEAKRRRTERTSRDGPEISVLKAAESRKAGLARTSGVTEGPLHSESARRRRGRPKGSPGKGRLEDKVERVEKDYDVYANLSEDKAFVFAVALAEINRKILNQRLLL
uniref:UPF0547 protein C16orf87 homolog n=1 Tax=Myxine glutinosa TaxID=7769 RepID=UPI00358E9CEB